MEFLYVISNPSMPGLIKVGRTTTSPEQRLKELNTTGVPTAFEIEVVFSVQDSSQAEKHAHKALIKFRENSRREFFKVSPKTAINKIIKSVPGLFVHLAKPGLDVDQIVMFHAQKKKDEEQARLQRIQEINEQKNKKIQALTNQLEHLTRKKLELGPMPDVKEPWWFFALFPFVIIDMARLFIYLIGAFFVFIGFNNGLNTFFTGVIALASAKGSHLTVKKYESFIKEKQNLLQRDHHKLHSDIGDVRRELNNLGHKL